METNSERILRIVGIKTERAKHHIKDVVGFADPAKMEEWIAFTHAKADDWGNAKPIRITDISLVTATGDAIHNLRSALDHLVFQLVLNNRGIPTNSTGFPIADSPKNLESIFERKVAGMSSTAKDAIQALKPYKGGNEPLWTIHHLDIVDKHRELIVFGYQNFFSSKAFPGIMAATPEKDAHFARFFTEDLDGKFDSSGQPIIPDVTASNNSALIPTLHDLLVYTEELVKSFASVIQ